MPAEKKTEEIEISPEDARKLAEAIRRIDKGMKEVAVAGLSRKALVVLINEATGVAKRDINSVLDGLESLGETFLEDASKTKKP